MALFDCTECKKEISDKADKCPNCGCPIESTTKTVNPNKKSASNNYKKFNFNDNEVELDYSKLMVHHNKNTKKDIKSYIKIAIWLFISSLFLLVVAINLGQKNFLGSLAGLFSLLFFAGSVGHIYKALRTVFSIGSKKSLRNEIENMRYHYYADNIKIFSSVPYDLEYEVTSAIHASSKEYLIRQAYLMKADALISVNLQKYSSSSTSGGTNLAGQNRVHTDVSTHENWSADAIIIKSENYYAPFCQINEDGSIEMTQNS